MKDLEFSIQETDDLLEHLYMRLRGKKEGLSLAEPAVILLQHLKTLNPQAYSLTIRRFSPILVDVLINGNHRQFGYDGLVALNCSSKDINLMSGDYTPERLNSGLEEVRAMIDDIQSSLEGKEPENRKEEDFTGRGSSRKIFRESARSSAYAPLVSIFNAGARHLVVGRMALFSVELRVTGEFSMRRQSDPVVTFDHMSSEPGSDFESQAFTSVRLAEHFAMTRLGLRDLGRIPREYRISMPALSSLESSSNAALSGSSAGVAMTSMLISAICGLHITKSRICLRKGISFTGAVDEEGRILAVEDQFMGEKVEAAFFSSVKSLFVPRENLESSRKSLEALKQEHPDRRLDLVTADTIDDVFDDRILAEKSKVFAGNLLAHRLFHWRKHLFALVPTVAALIIMYFVAPRYFDNVVSAGEVEIDRIKLFNKYGRTLKSFDLGYELRGDPSRQNRRILIDDYDGDGRKEEVCMVTESPMNVAKDFMPKNRLNVFVFSENANLLNKFVFDPEKVLGMELPDINKKKNMMISKPLLHYIDSTGRKSFYFALHFSNYPPVFILKYLPEEGRFERFLHDGFIQEMAIGDYDDDGKEEILAVGVNLTLDSAVLMLLDPNYISGGSPSCAEYDDIKGLVDIAKYYIKFPDFYRFKRYRSPALPLGAQIVYGSGQLGVTVNSSDEDVQFNFAGAMQCVSANVINSYKGSSTSPDSTIAVEYPGVATDELSLVSGIRYWNGSEWVREPVINQSYLEYIKNLKAAGG